MGQNMIFFVISIFLLLLIFSFLFLNIRKESKKSTYESLDMLRKKYPDELITFLVGQIIFLDE